MAQEDGYLEKLKEVSLDSLELQARLWHEWRRGIERVLGVGGGLLRNGTGKSSALEDFSFEAMRLSLEFQDKYLKLCSQHFDRVAESLGGRPSRRATPARLALAASVCGPREATTRMIVENPLGTKEDLLFGPAAFHDERGNGFRGAIEAARVDAPSLGPGEGLALDAYQSGLFELTISPETDFPATRCIGSARVFIGTEFLGDLTIEVPAYAPAAQPAPAQGRKVGKKRK